MRTHVFIVNEETFPKHLQYMFVGTGSKDKDEHPGLLTDSMPQKKMAFNPAFLKNLFIEHCLNPTKFTLKEYQNGRH